MKKKKLVKCGMTILASAGAIAAVFAASISSPSVTYAADGYDVQTLYEEGVKLDTELEEEGSVLFQNKNNALPLNSGTGLDLYGYVGYNIIHGGGGSGKGKWDSKCMFEKEAFELAGFKVNEKLWNWMGDPNGGNLVQESWVSDNGGTIINGQSYNVPELPVETYRKSKDVANPTDNIAVVTFGRQGHEGAELPQHMDSHTIDTNGTQAGEYDRTYLDPTQNELDLLKYLKEELGYKKIVVLINSSNVMTIGEYLQYSDACLWIGGPGEAGLIGVGNVLRGKDSAGKQLSPSGRTSDTWMSDFYSMPVFYNNGGSSYSNGFGGNWGGSPNYNQYEENIFVGYRWYETAYADGVKVTGTPRYAKDGSIAEEAKTYDFKNDYDDLIVMPFGGGLSYTTFDWTIVSSDVKLEKGGTNTVVVNVKNTGDYAGKDVVELYIHAPYNKGGIDKAEVTLAGFAKTGRLKPGEDGNVTITFNTDDIASYDYLGYKATASGTDHAGNPKWGGFVLESGEYEVRLQKDSHTQMTDPIKTTVAKDIIYTDEADGKRDQDATQAYNKLNDVNATDGTGMIYMHRSTISSDWDTIANKGATGYEKGGREDEVYGATRALPSDTTGKAQVSDKRSSTTVTYKVPYQDTTKECTYNYGFASSTEFVGNTCNYWGKDNNDQSYKDAVANVGKSTTKYTPDTRFVRGNEISSSDAITTDTDPKTSYGWDEIPYTDARWDNWVDQGSWADYAKIQGTSYLGGFDSMGLAQKSAADGPGEAGTGNQDDCTWWASEVVMASTWNRELIERVGQAYGKQCVRIGEDSCFGPAMNTHRSPFGGRNFEYYSEDGFLAGQMCIAETAGIQSEGVGTFNKHFMLNDLDGGRSGQMDFCSEQAIREIYIRAWEGSMKSKIAPMSGMMASLNRIGITWANRGLYTGIVREEYDWHGLIISDGMDGVTYSGEVKATFSGVACLLWSNALDKVSDAEMNDGSIFAVSSYNSGTACDMNTINDYYGAYQLREVAKTRLYYDTHIICKATVFDGSDWTMGESYNYDEMDVSNLTGQTDTIIKETTVGSDNTGIIVGSLIGGVVVVGLGVGIYFGSKKRKEKAE